MYASSPNLALAASSHFFLIPSFSAFLVGAYLPGGLVFGTYLVSVAYHTTKPRFPWLLHLDIAFAHVGHAVMIWTTAQWLPYSLPIYALFFSCAMITYYYGRAYQCLAWDPNPKVATWWHMFMHGFLGLSSAFSVLMAPVSKRNILYFFNK